WRIQRAHRGKKIRHIARIQAVYLLFETRQNGVKAGYQIPPLLLFIDESAEVALLQQLQATEHDIQTQLQLIIN
ncbi:hypothetical protein ACMUDL_19140, partial [Vibrio cholerae]|uniref:hypothetical protein n=1 Tax=Vibrio cholerae TaxID=666 RepID=UPI0039C90B5B